MKINEFKFLDLTLPEEIDPIWTEHWSRPYEYGYILKRIKEIKPKKCHNTGCGFQPIHLSFYNKIKDYIPIIINSDILETTMFPNYLKYDLTQPHAQKYDLVLCISIFEHLQNKKYVLDNLLNQVEDGGRLIFTCDFPDINISFLENYLESKCEKPNSSTLTGLSSKWPMNCFSNLAIVYLEIQK